MRVRSRWLTALPLATALLLTTGPAAAQQLTVERIFSPEFRVRGGGVGWLPGGERIARVDLDASGSYTDLVAEDVRTGEREVLVEGRRLVPEGAARPIAIEGYQWSPDRSKLLIFTNSQRVWRANTRGLYYVYDLASGRLTPLSRAEGWQQFAKWSPTGDRIGFVRDNDLFVVELPGFAERRLTSDGSEVVINGTFDWVYEEELGLQDGWRWSPDGRSIAFWRLDQSAVPTFYMIDDSSLYSRPVPLRYPKPGEPNSRVQIGVVDVGDGAVRWMDLGPEEDIYLARMEWAESPGEVMLQRLNRLQNRLEVLLGDASTGETRLLFAETDSAWVDVDDDFAWIRDGRELLWTSERDGYNHLYLYGRDGGVVRQLTRGEWDVTGLAGVDEQGGWVYFTAARPSPMEVQLFRVPLSGGEAERVSQEPGTHSVSLAPGGRYYADVRSSAGVPPVTGLHTVDGEVVRVLEDNAGVRQRLRSAGLNDPEFFQFTTSDGVRLNGYLIKPPGFDPARRYPVLMYAYGGPGVQTATDSWGGSRYLWHQLMAERGYLVATVDNRGTGSRGRDFRKMTYLNLGKWEANDQVEAARYLASLPYVDEGRIGMWGWSYGGYLTALTLMEGGDLFSAGISVAPVADWRLYDNLYTERFMRTPRENPGGYDRGSPLVRAAGLASDFLLIHGTADDNVHFQNSVQLAAALQEAGKQFDFMLYPNQTHSISFGSAPIHLFSLMTRWVEEHL